MDNEWFDKYMYEVVVRKEFVDPTLVKIYEDEKGFISLPPWDPLGALA